MRLIGVLGCVSSPSTILPSHLLNQQVKARLGGNHSARVALHNIDCNAIRADHPGDWATIAKLLLAELQVLLSFRPDCWIIANNTLHTVYDHIAHLLPPSPPMFHAVQLLCAHLLATGRQRILLLGTRFTMVDGSCATSLRAAGIGVDIPAAADRQRMEQIQRQLAAGEADPAAFADYFTSLIARHAAQGCDAVITACTELPLVVTQAISPVPVVNPLELQCSACVDFALAP